METPHPPVKRPSLFRGGLMGYLSAEFVGAIVCWILSSHSGDFDNQKVFTLLVCFGAFGAIGGYQFAARQRKRLGCNEPSDEWQQFYTSWTFKFLAAIVLIGAAAIDVVESFLFDLAYGAPWLQN